MDDLAEILAGDTEHVWAIVVAGCEDHLLRRIRARAAVSIARSDGEGFIAALDLLHHLVLVNFELIMFGRATVVLQRLTAYRFIAEGGHREVADFEQLRRGEKSHVRW